MIEFGKTTRTLLLGTVIATGALTLRSDAVHLAPRIESTPIAQPRQTEESKSTPQPKPGVPPQPRKVEQYLVDCALQPGASVAAELSAHSETTILGNADSTTREWREYVEITPRGTDGVTVEANGFTPVKHTTYDTSWSNTHAWSITSAATGASMAVARGPIDPFSGTGLADIRVTFSCPPADNPSAQPVPGK